MQIDLKILKIHHKFMDFMVLGIQQILTLFNTLVEFSFSQTLSFVKRKKKKTENMIGCLWFQTA